MKKSLKVLQKDARDCGSSCLLSIIKYYGGYVNLENLRLDTFTNRSGTTFFHLLKAAEKYGFEGYGAKLQLENICGDNLPVIAHVILENKMNHFVVIYKLAKNHVIIMDPSRGFVKMQKEQFNKIFTRRILILNPIIKILKCDSSNSLSYLFIKILKLEKNLILKTLITSLLLTILTILSSFYLKIALENLNIQDKSYINFLIIVFLGINLLKIILKYIKNTFEIFINKNIDIHLILPFIKHILLLPLNIVKSRTSAEVISRINDLNNIKNIFSKVFVTMSIDLFLSISSLIVLYHIHSNLFIGLLVILILYLILGLLSSKMIYPKIRKNIEYETEFNSLLMENVEGILSIKTIHQNNYFLKRVGNSLIKYLRDSFVFNKVLNRITFGKDFIYEVGLFLLNSIGIYQIIENKLDVLTLVTFNMVLGFVFDSLRNVVELFPAINHLKAIMSKVNDLNVLEEENLKSDNENFSFGDIKIKDLDYSYNNYNYQIKNLNLLINSKEHIFLKGKSGTGKSTLCKLLYGLINNYKGQIEIDNINIRDYKLNTIRESITYLSQDEQLFSITMKENIILDRNISTKKLDEILTITKVKEIIDSKALRLETLMLDGGYNFSGGEKQRIILARALVKECKILILDEALSEVPKEMEKEIIKNLREFYRDKTIIYVSHRNNEKLFSRTINLEVLNARV